MNKIVNQRYSSDCQLPHKKSIVLPIFPQSKQRNSHPATQLLRKQSQIQLLKKRISALCVRDQRYAHKTINSELELKKKESVKKQSARIQKLLEKERQIEAKQLQLLKSRNLKTRVDCYYRSRMQKQRKIQEIQEKSKVVRSRSRQYESTIVQNRANNILAKRSKNRQIIEDEKKALSQRSKILMKHREDAIQLEFREGEHMQKLEQIKDYQLRELGKLQLMMVEKSNTSRAAYEISRDRLKSRTSRSKFQNQPLRNSRYKAQTKFSVSLSLY